MTPEQQAWTDLERGRVEPSSRTIRAHAPAFPSYARVFFPVTSNGARPRSWSQALGRPVTPDVRWADCLSKDPDIETATGDLPWAVAAPLLRALDGGRDSIVFGFWAGHADTSLPATGFAGVFPPDGRELWFVRATGDDVAELTVDVGRGPMRWYPDHRRWSVTADVYDRSVIVGGDRPTIHAVLVSSDLEAVEVPDSLPSCALM
ncbi:hypothetical protein DEJ23_10150 [Curtobacterium sp. MCSS17_008]|uniref:hypothetical protein n=1 Tax=Curtobacterium sp. MCSS17_008 TaxID=2175647 RepID=UPI000DA6FC8A|nr:hypothetical protein [Curtobacterium sp. MCSS17_008]PZF56519.1 hypothetical protein DEJ23_10150 [Curtobacterium sp. MCSS17_008]